MCIASDLMNRHEQYVRGWVRLYPHDKEVAKVADYALKLQRMRVDHEKTCELCNAESVNGKAAA